MSCGCMKNSGNNNGVKQVTKKTASSTKYKPTPTKRRVIKRPAR